MREAEAGAAREGAGRAELREEYARLARRRALVAEKDALVSAHRSGQIGEEAFLSLLADADARLFELDEGEERPLTAGAPTSATS